jgi:ABC-type transport system involved in cytochrome c biogenesis permease subunit
VVRASVSEASRRTISSVLGIVLFVNLPIVWKAVEWWRGSLHPKHVTMTSDMRTTFLISMAAWLLFLAAAFQTRLRLEWLREAAAERAAAADAPERGAVAEGRP